MSESRVTVHMVASLDGFIARLDGSVDWLETADIYEAGDTMAPEYVEQFLKSIDCYVMGSRTYETAMKFTAAGHGWVYGDKPTFVLTTRTLPQIKPSVHFVAGDLRDIIQERLRREFASIWVVGGGTLCGACLRLGLADEVRLSLLPIVIGDGIPFFKEPGRDVALHLKDVKAYRNGMVALCHEVLR